MAGLIRNLTEIDWVRAPRFGVAALPDQRDGWEQIGLNVRVLGAVGVAAETGDRAVAYAGLAGLERIPYGGWLE
jgi:hypothetical protein